MGIKDHKAKKPRNPPNPKIEQAERLGNTLQTMIQSINQEQQADEDVPYLPPAVGAVQQKSPHEMDVDYFGE